MHDKQKNFGFTLVEVVISVFIVGIISTIAVIGFQSARQDDQLRMATMRLADALRLAQNYAQSGILTLPIEGGGYVSLNSADGYGIVVEGPEPKAFMYVDNRNMSVSPQVDNKYFGIGSAAVDQKIATLSFNVDNSDSIEIESIKLDGSTVTSADIAFKRPTASVYIDGNQDKSNVVIMFKNKKNNHTKTITVDRMTGRIDAEY